MKNYTKFAISPKKKTKKVEKPKKVTTPSIILKGGIEEITIKRLDPRDIEKYLWMHPVVPRGTEIKANRMIARGYTVGGKNTEANESMNNLLETSGGVILIKQWIKDGFGFGNGYKTLVPNEAGTRILRINSEHPIFFDIAKYDEKAKSELVKKYKINPYTKEPEAYTQLTYDSGKNLVPTGKELPRDRVAHLKFDTWGDEALGISLVQYLQLTLKYLMNMEEAGAETLIKNGFVQKSVSTNITSEKELKKLAKNLSDINHKDAIICPSGTEITNLIPGTSDFPRFHQVFITLLAIRLGIPKPLLTMDGTSTNKATLTEQKKDIRADVSADELVVERTINEQIFKPACLLQFGEGFKDFPTFKFNPMIEDKELRAERYKIISETTQRFIQAASILKDMGKEKEAGVIIEQALQGLDNGLKRED